MSTQVSKTELRKRLLSKRDALSLREHERLSSSIVANLKLDSDVLAARTILSYLPIGSEVDITAFNAWALLEGKTLAYPLVLSKEKMVAAAPNNNNAFVKGSLGVQAPDPLNSIIIEPQELTCILVPCLGYNNKNYRLGMGGGFFDRYLIACENANFIGVAFSFQCISELQADVWDIPLNRMVTESKTARI